MGIRISYLTPAEQFLYLERKMMNFKVILACLTITNVVLIDSKPAAFNFDSLENALREMDITLKQGDNVEPIENQEEHGHSLEKRRADDLDEEERQLEALIEEVEGNPEPSSVRVEGEGIPTITNNAEASRVEAALKEEEKKLLTEGEKAFQEFGKNINEAIKQNEAVVNEVEKDMDEGINYP